MTQYDDVAEDYESRVVPRFRAIAERLVAEADIRLGDRTLEIAAGTGGLSRLVAPRLGRRGSLVLSDIAAEMLAVGALVLLELPAGPAGLPEIDTVVADIARLPFEDRAFDLVLGQMTPLVDNEPGIAEVFRVLRPAGRLAFATWGATYQENRMLNAARASVGVEPYPRVHLRAIAPRLRRAGFTTVEQRTRPMTVVHRDIPAYLAYRLGFGQVGWTGETVTAYLAALEREVRTVAPGTGPVRLGWSITIVTAAKPAS